MHQPSQSPPNFQDLYAQVVRTASFDFVHSLVIATPDAGLVFSKRQKAVMTLGDGRNTNPTQFMF
jgi:hypothetical protein